MAIRFRCGNCDQLMSIATRMAGQVTHCARCGAELIVPDERPESVGGEVLVVEPNVSSIDDPFAADEEDASQSESAESEDRTPPFESELESSSETDEQQPSEAITTGPLPDVPIHSRPTLAETSDEEDAVFRVKRRGGQVEEMDLTPMVDVTFLLLIFFMITSSFSLHKTLAVPPPNPDEQGAMQSIQRIEDLLDGSIKVEVDAQNAVFVDDTLITDPKTLPDVLREKMREDDKAELVIILDRESRHEMLVTVVDAAQEVGMQRIRRVASAPGN